MMKKIIENNNEELLISYQKGGFFDINFGRHICPDKQIK